MPSNICTGRNASDRLPDLLFIVGIIIHKSWPQTKRKSFYFVKIANLLNRPSSWWFFHTLLRLWMWTESQSRLLASKPMYGLHLTAFVRLGHFGQSRIILLTLVQDVPRLCHSIIKSVVLLIRCCGPLVMYTIVDAP